MDLPQCKRNGLNFARNRHFRKPGLWRHLGDFRQNMDFLVVLASSHFRAELTRRKRAPMGSCLDQRDRATCGFVRVRPHGKPGKQKKSTGGLAGLCPRGGYGDPGCADVQTGTDRGRSRKHARTSRAPCWVHEKSAELPRMPRAARRSSCSTCVPAI